MTFARIPRTITLGAVGQLGCSGRFTRYPKLRLIFHRRSRKHRGDKSHLRELETIYKAAGIASRFDAPPENLLLWTDNNISAENENRNVRKYMCCRAISGTCAKRDTERY